jgi:hypothetical protein
MATAPARLPHAGQAGGRIALGPAPGRATLRGIAPLLALYGLYTLLRWLVADRGPTLGLDNADRIIGWERSLRLYHEIGLQSAALSSLHLVRVANWYYVAGFLPVLVAAGILAAHRAPEVFHWWRGVFVVSLVTAVIGYTLYPLTPPRLLPESYGYIDTLLRYGPHYYGDATGASLFNAYGSIPSTVNEYAAMPSMHVAWSVVAGALLAAVFRYAWWAICLAVTHPILMAVAVVITANHFILDVVAGLIVLVASIPLAWVIRRAATGLHGPSL